MGVTSEDGFSLLYPTSRQNQPFALIFPRGKYAMIECIKEEIFMLDWVIRGGTVIDGSGGAPFRADIGIRGGKIAAVGSCGEAAQTLDAAGRYVTPGFLDIHRHGDAAVFPPRLRPCGAAAGADRHRQRQLRSVACAVRRGAPGRAAALSRGDHGRHRPGHPHGVHGGLSGRTARPAAAAARRHARRRRDGARGLLRLCAERCG